MAAVDDGAAGQAVQGCREEGARETLVRSSQSGRGTGAQPWCSQRD